MIPGRRFSYCLAALTVSASSLLGAMCFLVACSSSSADAPPRPDAAADGAPEASPEGDALVPDAPADGGSLDAAPDSSPTADAAVDSAPSDCVPLPTQDGGYPAVTIIEDSMTRPRAIAVDPSGIYVITGDGFGTGSSAVQRISFDGGAPTTLATADAGSEQLAIDSNSAYWVTSGGSSGDGNLLRVPLQGGATTSLATVSNGYAVAVYGSDVFFTDYYPTPGSLLTVALDGDGGAPLQTQTSQLLIANDAVAASVAGEFWLAANNDGAGQLNVGQVWMAPPGGGGEGKLLAQGQTAPLQIAVDDTNVYWTNQGDGMSIHGSVVKVPIAGGAPVTLATMCDITSQPWAIAVADGQVYFTVQQDTTPWNIESVPAAGGPATLMSVSVAPMSLAVDAHNLYFADSSLGAVGFVPRQ
jgi:hypothetical protein